MSIVIGWPEGIYIALNLLGLAIIIPEHGKMVQRNAWAALLGWMLVLPLLYWGGFFS